MRFPVEGKTMPRGLSDPDGSGGLGKKLDSLSYDIVGAALEVHKALGPGFLESVYENALCIELEKKKLKVDRQKPVAVFYKGELVGEHKLDLLIEDSIILELKAVDNLSPVHASQLLHYLRATGLKLGLLLNFNTARLKDGIQRIIN